MLEVSAEDWIAKVSILLGTYLMKVPHMVHLLTGGYHVLTAGSHYQKLSVLVYVF
jgi:hypothetical protein